jgi:lantibiotic biosynthesis protein
MALQPWKAILTGHDAERARHIALGIADAAAARSHNHSDPFAVFLDAYLAVELASDRHAERALDALEEVAASSGGIRSPSLYGGLAGLGFTLQHVMGLLSDWIEGDHTEAFGDFDEVLLQAARSYPPKREYDLISGLAGLATFAAERLPSEAGRSLLEVILERIAADAEQGPDGTTWRTDPKLVPVHQRPEAPEGYYNLGVAHGVAGLAVALARAAAAGARSADARRLAHSARKWISKQTSDRGEGARFPAFVPVGGPIPSGTREAWCYGGLGMSVSMLAAARLLGDTAWEDECCEYGRREAVRPKETSGVVDCGLCHGAAGNGHLYNRLYQATGDEIFLAAAHRWLRHVLEAYRPDDAPGGYLFWLPVPHTKGLSWQASHGFLTGTAGVALALLAAASDREPKWDRVLAADIAMRS